MTHSLAQIVTYGLLIVAPFFIIEWFTTDGFSSEGFPLVLFVFMWINGIIFSGALRLALKHIRNGSVRSNVLEFTCVSALFLLSLAGLLHIIRDQMPCFLGGSGC